MATNALNVLSECDRIIMLENGEIVDIGTYEDMIKKHVEFTQFVGKYIDIEESLRLGEFLFFLFVFIVYI